MYINVTRKLALLMPSVGVLLPSAVKYFAAILRPIRTLLFLFYLFGGLYDYNPLI